MSRRAATPGRRCRRRAPRSSSTPCHIRTAGGGIRRNGCWSNGETRPSRRRSGRWRPPRRDARTRLHALWTLDGNDSIDVPTVTQALGDASRDVRVSAIRLAERWLGEGNHPIQAAVLKRLDDPDWAVRQQLAASLGVLPAGPRETRRGRLARTPCGRPDHPRRGTEWHSRQRTCGARADPGDGGRSREATSVSPGGGSRDAASAPVSQVTSVPALEAAMTMLAATIVRAAQDAAIQQVLAAIADETRPIWQRSALLRGAEVALLGATMPGTPARRGGPAAAAGHAGTLPDVSWWTCGTGGAYAFPQVPPTGDRSRRRAAAPAEW